MGRWEWRVFLKGRRLLVSSSLQGSVNSAKSSIFKEAKGGLLVGNLPRKSAQSLLGMFRRFNQPAIDWLLIY